MNTFTLPKICDRAAARSLHPDLRDAVGPEKLCIDASEVERVGQAMLQVLLSAAKSESGIVLTTPSEPFMAALRLTGLETALGVDIERSEPA